MKKRNIPKKEKSMAYTLIKFSLPLIFSGILQQLYSWADAFIVGNIDGEAALAAIGSTGSVINFFLMIVNGFTVGLAILFAQKYGARKQEDIRKILSTFSVLMGGLMLLLACMGILFAFPLLKMMNVPLSVFQMAKEYLETVLMGVPFLAIYNIYSAALRGVGDSKAPFYSILVSSVCNILLDIVLVGVLRWSVRGAAVATVISQIAMTIFLIIYAIKKHEDLRINKIKIEMVSLKEGLKFGVPPMIQSSVTACGNLLLQNFMNGFGMETVAAITTAYRIDSIVILPMLHLGSGISTITAQNYGAGEEEQVKKVLKVGLGLMAVISLLMTLLVIPTGGILISLFGVGKTAIEIGEAFFLRLASFYFILGMGMAIRGYLEGIGDVVYSSTAGIITLAARILFSYLLVAFTGNMVIAYAEGISWAVMLLLYAVRLIKTEKLRKNNRSVSF